MKTNQEGQKPDEVKFSLLMEQSRRLQGGMGAIAWGVLEVLKRGGMPDSERERLYERMSECLIKPSGRECSAILRVVEARLMEERETQSGVWYL